MRKALILSVILVLALAGTSLAWDPMVKGPRLNYMGYASQYGDGTVDADTLIAVFNPNPVPIHVRVHLFDKYGNVIMENARLLDGGISIDTIPPMGMGWTTIGLMAVMRQPNPGLAPLKYPFVITWTPVQGMSWRPLVAEIKELLYTNRVAPGDCWTPSSIRAWSEAALSKGAGKYGGGLGYSQ
jgi:hypothetical protein